MPDNTVCVMRRPKRLALYAHFNEDDSIKPYVIYILKSLYLNTEEIWFISNSTLNKSSHEQLKSYCKNIYLRENTGLDFGMWKHVMHDIDCQAWDEILLINSSIYGPINPIEPIFAEIDNTSGDIIGLTDSRELDYHLQSYFLLFRSSVFRSDYWLQFWDSILPFTDKKQIIRSYEIGLSKWFLQHGFILKSLFPINKILFGRLQIKSTYYLSLSRIVCKDCNPVIKLPDLLLASGFPFLKLEVVRRNPCKVPISRIRKHIQASNYPEDIIAYEVRK